MSLTPDEAATSLRAVNQTQQRSREAFNYSQSAPHCLLWGVTWMVGYGGEALLTYPFRGWHWLVVLLAGNIGSTLLGRRQRQSSLAGWRIGVVMLVINVFSIAVFFVMAPISVLKVGVYWPLLFSAVYVCLGLWMGLRYILVGLFMAAAALGGFYFLREHFFLWMALVGGGSLLLTGFWLKKV